MFWFSRYINKIVLLLLFLIVSSSSCKDSYQSVIPYAYVNIDVSLTNVIELNVPGGAAYFNGGFAGVIAYRDFDGNIYAFDAACTNEISTTCQVEVGEGTGMATCPCCGSQFYLIYGNGKVTQGPAVAPLKHYRTREYGGRLQITN